MKTITKLIIQTRDKNKVNVYLNNDYFGSLSLEVVIKNHLKENMMIDEKVLENLCLESEKTLAYNKALNLVATRYKTQKEVEKYLYEKEYKPETVFYVIKKLVEYNFIDDERYVESFVSHHIEKDGVIKIKQQLLMKGVEEQIINNAINKYDNQFEQINLCKQKFMKNKEETKENYAKLYRHLLSKGFRPDEILKVLKNEIE